LHAAASWSALLALALFFALDGSFIARAVFSPSLLVWLCSLAHRWALGCSKSGVSDIGTALGFLTKIQEIAGTEHL
jgi:hypothetical protein